MTADTTPKQDIEQPAAQHENHHATTDCVITLIGSATLIIALIVLGWTNRSEAAGQNWCGEYRDGYQIGYCWTRKECTYIPPRMCPYPEDGQDDGFMVGLKEGLAEGKEAE
jgi:hypothetical protein